MMVDGKVVIVTGAARGIGREYVRALAAGGARVVAADINDCADTVALAKSTGNVISVRTDVADSRSAMAMVEAATGAFGRLDGLVNNAALYASFRDGRFDAIDEADRDAAMRVNVRGIWNCCKAPVPEMRKSGGGSIVNVASLAAPPMVWPMRCTIRR